MLSTAARPATLADLIAPSSRLCDVLLVVTASLVTALASQAEIRLGFTPVPVTLQTLAVCLAGATLGSRRGALAMLLYLAEGAAGLPFFAGGAGGAAHLAGPTGGYLIGFVPAAFAVGWLSERGWDRSPWRAAAAMTLGTLVLFACGLLQLAAFVGAPRVLALGFYPFLWGAVLKIALASALLPSAWAFVRR
jgi:biotin transport system substrate-specific component